MASDIAIIGGGLTGLIVADRLHAAGVGFDLFEARDRFGGRVHGFDALGAKFDLGPTWFWPGQPRMAALADGLGASVFEQYARGDLTYQDHSGVQRGRGFASMEGSLRIAGGISALIDGLVARLPRARLHLSAAVTEVSEARGVVLADGTVHPASTAVLALPPRLAADLTFDPPLAAPVRQSLSDIPTWMGGHAKFVAVYDTAFWRGDGLSGDAMSRIGPMVEIHDASPDNGTPGALFGFLGVPPEARAGQDEGLIAACLSQLEALFGPQASAPVKAQLLDWAFEPATAHPTDHAPLLSHPDYAMPPVVAQASNGFVRFAGTELAPEMGGFLEGAIASGEAVAADLIAERV